jgi:hypothetical protein
VEGKKGIYGIITAFFVICIAIFVVLALTQVMSLSTLFKVQQADDYKKDISASGARGLVRSCFGRIVDPAKLNDTQCLGDVKAISILVSNSSGCTAINTTIRDPAGYSSIAAFNQPVREGFRICPGRLLVYT